MPAIALTLRAKQIVKNNVHNLQQPLPDSNIWNRKKGQSFACDVGIFDKDYDFQDSFDSWWVFNLKFRTSGPKKLTLLGVLPL